MLEASDPRLREMVAFALGRLVQVLIVVTLVFALTENLVFLSQVNKNFHSSCVCSRFPSFVDSHHGHVISANLNILSRPSLIELFSRGTKFRSGFLFMLSIEEAIDKVLKKFVNKQEELLGVQGILSEWKAKVLVFVQKRTRASFVVQTSSDSPLSVPLGDLDHLKFFQQSFVITYMDKCCNKLCVCFGMVSPGALVFLGGQIKIPAASFV
jgi:hypothetical protein